MSFACTQTPPSDGADPSTKTSKAQWPSMMSETILSSEPPKATSTLSIAHQVITLSCCDGGWWVEGGGGCGGVCVVCCIHT